MNSSVPIRDVLVRGIIGGIIAGLVVSLWFLVVDSIAGQPLTTPAVLGQAVMQLPEFAMTPRLLLGYSALHFGVFIALGIAATWLLRVLHLTPSLLLGIGFGVFALDVVYYGALLVAGGNVLELVDWYHVVPANALAGMALMAYLHRASHEERPLGWGVLREHPRVAEGLLTGLLGAVVVAAWFFLLDLANGRPFYTPAALGSAVFLNAQSEAGIRMTVGIIAGFTALHVALFGIVGVVVVAVADYLERQPSRILMVVMGAIVIDAVMVPTLALTAEWVLGALGIWAVIVGNILAVVAMVWYAWRKHPALRERLEHAPVDV